MMQDWESERGDLGDGLFAVLVVCLGLIFVSAAVKGTAKIIGWIWGFE